MSAGDVLKSDLFDIIEPRSVAATLYATEGSTLSGTAVMVVVGVLTLEFAVVYVYFKRHAWDGC